MCVLLEYFLEKKIPSDRRSHLGWGRFTEIFLSYIMKNGKNDMEWQTGMQGMIWDWISLKEKKKIEYKVWVWVIFGII